ncbi:MULTISPECIES: hypothetical protein [Caballeronia]|uniref:Uncharacterized protein n=1 Tax=Caballeronia zhejiangensis TaxID=871203 RepID=A0A656QD40_9BURK|nr:MULTISPECIES: hypothetical protein [Caballeronia]EKS72037.1 hypothetical protein BURK_009401 [Burkholderia sp. SJ98]KDR26212.1 hypothetical protein BG60_23795 [Caballeronia zhejiangensis]
MWSIFMITVTALFAVQVVRAKRSYFWPGAPFLIQAIFKMFEAKPPEPTSTLTAVAVAFLAYYIVGQLRPRSKDEDVPPAAPGA